MNTITINETTIGQGARVYIIAEMSANHNQRLDHAIEIIHRAKQAGADAVKLQTYTTFFQPPSMPPLWTSLKPWQCQPIKSPHLN